MYRQQPLKRGSLYAVTCSNPTDVSRPFTAPTRPPMSCTCTETWCTRGQSSCLTPRSTSSSARSTLTLSRSTHLQPLHGQTCCQLSGWLLQRSLMIAHQARCHGMRACPLCPHSVCTYSDGATKHTQRSGVTKTTAQHTCMPVAAPT